MEKVVDYYKLLHVQRDAPLAIIKASYRALMQKMKHHPDLGGDEDTAKQLNLAMHVLSDEAKRAAYDQSLGPAEQHGASHAQPKCSSTSKPSTPAHVTRLPKAACCAFCQTSIAAMLSAPDAANEFIGISYGQTECSRCGAAISPIRVIADLCSEDLRRLHRQAQKLPVKFWDRWPAEAAIEASVCDFSPAGCALLCEQRYPLGQRLKLSTALFDAVCQVCFCKASATDDSNLIGLEFITLNLKSNPGDFVSISA